MATVLIADDNVRHLAQLRAGIEGEGHTVIEAMDGHDATELAVSEQPDMVILAVALPIFNALEAAQILRNDPDIPRELPIVVLASNPLNPRDLEKAGITDTLDTAHNQADLREFLARHLGSKAA